MSYVVIIVYIHNCIYSITYNRCYLHLEYIYIRNVPEVKMSLMNQLYYVLIFSFSKQYYIAQLSYVIT